MLRFNLSHLVASLFCLLLLACEHDHHEHNHDDDDHHAHESEDTRTIPSEKTDLILIQNQFTLNSGLFNNVLRDISEKEATIQINEHTNTIQWITGHALNILYNLGNMLEVVEENPYKKWFGSGKPFEASADYPSLAKMKKDWAELAPKIEAAMAELSVTQLDKPSPFKVPFFKEQSIRGTIAFQMHHLGYEIGQLGLYRRFLGKAAMSYQ